jgi:adenosylhomocysteine nucleosidase
LGDVVAVTGTQREASVLRGLGVTALAIGGRAEALDHLSLPVSGIISFGMAGALSPDLRVGDWVIGGSLCGAVEAVCDPAWVAVLARQLPAARIGACYADGRLIGNSAEKQRLHQFTGAIIADMESHIVARTAARLGVPFAILRCISDEAARSLPPLIEVAMRPDGGLAMGRIAASLVRQPGQLLELSRTLRAFNAGFSAMKRSAASLLGRLAFDLR